jgi:hypothetical protein
MITVYPNPQSARIIVKAVADQKKILWVVGPGTYYFNPTITPGSIAGVCSSPVDPAAFGADYLIQQGTSGFASAASAAGLYAWNGLTSEAEDDKAASQVLDGAKFIKAPVIVG